jgi:hypothetical protein
MSSTLDLDYVFPVSEGLLDFDEMDCFISGPEVTVVEDYELHFTRKLQAIFILFNFPFFL